MVLSVRSAKQEVDLRLLYKAPPQSVGAWSWESSPFRRGICQILYVE